MKKSPPPTPLDIVALAQVFSLALALALAEALPLTASAAAPSSPAPQGDALEVRTLSPGAARAERRDRDVDQVALSAQESAIARLGALLRRYRDRSQEPVLLARLAELQQQKAALVFRLLHGDLKRHGRAMGRYQDAMARTVATLDALIARYPGYSDIAHAYFMRGKCREEMDDAAGATRDYLHLVRHFPEAEETAAAYMSLAEFAIDANNHPLAITYLREIEKRPEDPHYPFALYKLAWSYYNLKDIAHALSYAEAQIHFYDERRKAGIAEGSAPEPADASSSDAALRENTLLDIPIFYFDGIENGRDGYRVADALDYFRKLENGPVLGRMAVRFAKLLRSRDMDDELVRWKDRFIAQGSPDALRPEAMDLLLITYEHQLNRRQYARLVDSARDMVRLRELHHGRIEGLGRAQKLLLDTAVSLQALIVKNRETGRARDLSTVLASIYDSFTRIVEQDDPRIAEVHYNLAETLYAIRDFEGSALHYRWIVEHPGKEGRPGQQRLADAGLKAISARYESLRERHLIPGEIHVVACSPLLDGKPAPYSLGKLDPSLREWIGWVDSRMSQARVAREREELENFSFEASRALYAQGELPAAVARLAGFARDNPSSPYAIPSASLVLDSAIAASDWDGVFTLATRYSRLRAWRGTPFGRRLLEIAGDSLYKKMEARFRAGKYEETLSDVDSFLQEYPSSPRVADCLSLAGAAALADHQIDRAMSYFSRLIQSPLAGPRVSEALLARARIEEDRDLFAAAMGDYQAVLALPPALLPERIRKDPAQLVPLRRKTLLLGWLAGDPGALQSLLASPSVCAPEMASDCEPYAALSALARAARDPSSAPDRMATLRAFNHARKMRAGPARTLWSLHALQGARHLAFRDRNLMLRSIGSGYSDLDPVMKLAVLPYLNSSVPAAFAMNRVALKDVAPLRADERYITHRVDSIREMENAAARVMLLPWARIRAEVMNETAELYLDLSRELSSLPPPNGLSARDSVVYQETIRRMTMPFEEKGEDIRSRAFEIASRSAIEDESFQSIAKAFFAENPSQARKLRGQPIGPKAPATVPPTLSFTRLDLQYAPELEKLHHGPMPAFYPIWMNAARAGNWAQATVLIQEAHEKALLGEGELGLLRAISLSLAGARAEALSVLDEARGKLDGRLKSLTTLTLARYFAETLARDRAEALFREIEVIPTRELAKSPARVAQNKE